MQNNAGGKMKKIVISNQKGGVGKTCLSTHIAHCAIEKNLKVLFKGVSIYFIDLFKILSTGLFSIK